MLFTLQRYEFFSKSQPLIVIIISQSRCCLPYKGTNFSANHNEAQFRMTTANDVVYPTKVRIFQQITTRASRKFWARGMLFTLQRYEFFSKSQLKDVNSYIDVRCCLPYKGTNFSANHNCLTTQAITTNDVVYPTKVRIFQQITTGVTIDKVVELMLFTLQRYEFFSKSQRSSTA